jgi:hypothetical protein
VTAAQAIADLLAAYNDAAGRTTSPVAVAGNLGGQTLGCGLYKSTSSLEISSGDLTLDGHGDPTAVWIFQMASTFQTVSGRQVLLAGGAKSENVFWQVGTSATLGTTSVVEGTIMADQSITLLTGAVLNGRALARIAAVNLDGNAIVVPVPSAGPSILSVGLMGNFATVYIPANTNLGVSNITFSVFQSAASIPCSAPFHISSVSSPFGSPLSYISVFALSLALAANRI